MTELLDLDLGGILKDSSRELSLFQRLKLARDVCLGEEQIYIYIYIEREREKEKERKRDREKERKTQIN